MPRRTAKDFLAVLAVDFGTAYSGYAFSFRSQQDKIFMGKNWGGTVAESKTITSVLVEKSEGSFKAKAFGHDAEEQYAEYLLFPEGDEVFLFRRFKMQLHKKTVNPRMELESVDSKLKLPAVEVFSMALECIKKKAVADIFKSVSSGKQDILWVLTLPAIWSDAAKNFMRLAAHKAGLISELDSDQLLIALEPEAASIFCRSKEVGCVFEGGGPDMPEGTQYLVVDSGGGTVDIASHEITDGGAIKELYRPSGGDWGGTMVDRLFTDVMAEIVSKDFIEKLKQTSSVTWLNVLQTFENMKRVKAMKFLSLEVQSEFNKQYKSITGKELESAFKSYSGNADMRNGRMVFKMDIVRKLFMPVIESSIKHVKDLLKKKELRNISYLMLVGGFSECEMLQQAFRDAFEPRLKVIIPQETILAVLKGAVMFGHNPVTIVSRKAKCTYGFAVNEDFEEGKHDTRKAVKGLNGQLVVKDIFSVFVKKGEEIESGSSRTKQFYPSTMSAHTGVLKLYAADKDNVTYTYDPGVTEIGCISLQVPPSDDLNKPIDVQICFGDTEVHVEMQGATAKEGGSAKLSFLL